jgi:hypothetical protein
VDLQAKEALECVFGERAWSLDYFLFCLDDSIGVMAFGFDVLVESFERSKSLPN